MDFWTLLAALAAALFAGLTFFRDTLRGCATASADVSEITLKVTVRNPGAAPIFVGRVWLIGAEAGEDTAIPPYGDVAVKPTGRRFFEMNKTVPGGGQESAESYWVAHRKHRYARAHLVPASILGFGREYVVIVRLIR